MQKKIRSGGNSGNEQKWVYLILPKAYAMLPIGKMMRMLHGEQTKSPGGRNSGAFLCVPSTALILHLRGSVQRRVLEIGNT